MEKKITVVSLIALLILLSSPGVSASLANWNVYETNDFVVFYPDGYQYEAVDALYYLQKYKQQTLELTGNIREFKPYVVLQDIGVISNGYANPLPYKISIFTNNPGTYSRLQGLETGHNFIRGVSVHEYTHLGQLTNSSGLSKLACLLFGNHKSSNIYSPGWIVEGITVYQESQLNDFDGRLNAGYFDAVIASKAQADKLPTIMQATYNPGDYPQGFDYLYGGSFFEYLANQYGEDKLADYFTDYGSNPWWAIVKQTFPGLGIDFAARKVYGKSYPQLFAEWRDYETKQHQDWKITGQELVDNEGGSIFNLTVHGDKLYYFQEQSLTQAPYSQPKILKLMEYNLKTGKIKLLKKLKNRAYSSFQIINNKLYYGVKDYASGFPNIDWLGKGIVGTIQQYDLSTGQVRDILTAEFKDFVVLNSGQIIYAQEDNEEFGSEIWQYTGQEKEKLGRVNQLISEIRPYKEQFLVVSKQKGDSWNINQFKLNDLSLTSLVATPAMERFIQYSQNNNKLYFTANYNQTYSTYSYDFASKKIEKLTASDYANQGVVKDNNLYYIGLDSTGEKIYKEQVTKVAYQPPKERADSIQEEVKLPEKAQKGNVVGKNFSYLLKPYQRFFLYPVAGSDALGLNSYLSIPEISWKEERGYGFAADFQFTTRMWKPLIISLDTPTMATSNVEIEDKNSVLGITYPIYNSLSNGISAITVTGRTDFESIEPGINVSFSYPQQKVYTGFYYDSLAQILVSNLSYQYLLKNGSLQIKGNIETATERTIVSLERLGYFHQLGKIRKGLWNPNLFIGDMYGSVYVEPGRLGIGDKKAEITTYGYEFLFETGIALNLNFVTKMGISVTEDDLEPKPYLRLGTSF